ncbi:DEAD/DEAH box helicase [Phocaeicola plebeius]|jgi:SNF2 family DNA or RNA helicase|uniref:DEAD/DEAH box helicase n=1 Tax=Phocaeicola plebeius TaxID=310297 RepID=UPI0026EF3B45|nr:DEAD/DEAH box helicase [Phocaeicola plebeius]
MSSNNKSASENKARKKKNKPNNKKVQNLSNVLKPDNMELTEWQKALRRQVAIQEHFIVSQNTQTDEPGCYSVANPKTDNEYKVIYRGANCKWNYCSCMDFKVSRLGTCKHIEAVCSWIKKRRKTLDKTLPSYTAVYLLYQEGRKICIRIGTEKSEEFTRLASEYFTNDGYLKPESIYSFSTFLSTARKISNTFRCYPDALQYILDLRDDRKRAELVSEKCTDKNLDSLLNARLYPYQKEGIRFAIKTGKTIIADEMGLGKTIQAIGCAEFMRKENLISSVLIVCPTSLKYQWKKEIERFTGCQSVVIEGNHLRRKKMYDDSTFYKIVSYNSICNDVKILRHMSTDFMIMDEAQRLKNWNTQVAQAMRRIHADYMVVLSGTPLENKLQELYSIVQIVNPFLLGPLHEFIADTTVLSPSGQIIGYKNLNEIGERLKGVMIRRRKSDVKLQLPSRMDSIRFVPMTKEQAGMHDEFHSVVSQIVTKWNKTHFLSEKDRKRLLLLLSQMRMACDSTFILDQRSRHDTKIDELMHMVEDMIENGDDKMVVFSQWERMTRLVCQELEKRGIMYANLNGSVPSEKRKQLMDDFTSNPDCRIFVSTDAGSTGLNLQVASVLVNLDLPWNPAVLEQRIARIYRIGQTKSVQVFNMVAERTIEERMLSTLNFKSNMSEGILDNGTDAVFMEESKFNRLMETVEEVTASDGKPEFAETHTDDTTEHATEELIEDIPLEADNNYEVETKQGTGESTFPHELVSQGMSFLQGLAETLASPEKTQVLIDTLVKEDKVTGKTSIEIPVPDKETVKNLFSMFSKLICQK